MHRRGFLQAMLVMIAAVLAGWRPKPALARTVTPKPLPPEPPNWPVAPVVAFSGSQRWVRGYAGPLMRYRSGGVEIDHYEGNAIPPDAVYVFAYDQSGHGHHAYAAGPALAVWDRALTPSEIAAVERYGSSIR